MSEKQTCPKCGTESDGSTICCPIYHGRTGDGFCPIFADGQTAAEVAKEYHDCWLREARENAELRRQISALKARSLISRFFNFSAPQQGSER